MGTEKGLEKENVLEKENKKIVLPGDSLGTEEEFIPGYGTAVAEDGEVLSAALGEAKMIGRKMNVESEVPGMGLYPITIGTIVYGRVESESPMMALAQVGYPKVGGKRASNYSGFAGLHISRAKKGYTKSMSEVVRVGDLLRAKIVKYNARQGLIDVSTDDKHNGVILAFCSLCRQRMVKIGTDEVKCTQCENIESRKLADDYGSVEGIL